jgi:CheY-like chemotaxis protein
MYFPCLISVPSAGLQSRAAPMRISMGRFLYSGLTRSEICFMAPRILVVDDEPMVRALIARVLSDEGYEVVSVANGRAALEVARAADGAFDLIVTNNYMPGLNGAELVARVREDFPTLPILHIDDITHRKSAHEITDDVPTVYKPFKVATLREAVRQLLAG